MLGELLLAAWTSVAPMEQDTLPARLHDVKSEVEKTGLFVEPKNPIYFPVRRGDEVNLEKKSFGRNCMSVTGSTNSLKTVYQALSCSEDYDSEGEYLAIRFWDVEMGMPGPLETVISFNEEQELVECYCLPRQSKNSQPMPLDDCNRLFDNYINGLDNSSQN